MGEMAMKRLRKWLSNEDGFTLTEIVVSTFLITIGLVSVAAVLSTAANRQNFSQGLTTATNLATSKLEEIKTVPYDLLTSGEEGFGTIENFISYKRELYVTPNGDDTLKVVKVVVTNAVGQQVAIETVVVR